MLDSILSIMQLALPLVFILGALPGQRRWERAIVLNGTVAIGVLFAAIATPTLITAGLLAETGTAVQYGPTAPGQAIAVLVGFLGMVIARFAQNYLRGELDRDRFLTHLQMTLAGVVCVVLTNHLLILLGGWLVISLSLHRLLLFYPDRPRAVLAAHKKFLLARAAEALLLLAVLLLYSEFGTWQLSEIRAAATASTPGDAASFAAVLIALVALIKCAQLPMHGWLIQVVEAPTPVSALLHAGVINLGGYLLIAFAPLLAQVPLAQWLLLIVAGGTLVLAALIMSMQTSVKVRLAWSTSAQMGLMLVQCALGLHTLALLHLLAHACYKAYSFLSAGSAVAVWDDRRLFPMPERGATTWLLPVLAGVVAVAVVATVFGSGAISPWMLLLALLIFMLFEFGAAGGRQPVLGAAALALLVVVAYVGQKLAITALMPTLNTSAPSGADLWLSGLILLLSATFWLLRVRAEKPLTRRLALLLLAGFYIDEWFTRVTLWLWPLRLPARTNVKRFAESGGEAVR